MKIIILSHKRSLNKAEGLIEAYKDQEIYLVSDISPNKERRPFFKNVKSFVSKGFDPVHITSNITTCDKIYTVSENLLPLQSQLESFYGIDNISPFAAEVLSNKQYFDDYCRTIGLEDFVPKSITPTFHSQLEIFSNKEIFTKPDIGTGTNVFLPDTDQNIPKIEYRRWNNYHHFLKFLKNTNFHNDFFNYNKSGIQNERFNYKSCKTMVQEYFFSEEPCLIPVGYVKNGIVNNICYLKTTKVNYGDLLDPLLTPIELHNKSRTSDIGKDLAVWSVKNEEVLPERHEKMQFFLQTLIDNLKIQDMIFVGPDFHISKGKLIAIDFNPRPGQFMNILNKLNGNTIFPDILSERTVEIKNQLLW